MQAGEGKPGKVQIKKKIVQMTANTGGAENKLRREGRFAADQGKTNLSRDTNQSRNNQFLPVPPQTKVGASGQMDVKMLLLPTARWYGQKAVVAHPARLLVLVL